MTKFIVYAEVVTTTWESYEIEVPDEVLAASVDYTDDTVIVYANGQIAHTNGDRDDTPFIPEGWERRTSDDGSPLVRRHIYDMDEPEDEEEDEDAE